MPTENPNTVRPPEPRNPAPPQAPDQAEVGSVLAREQDPYLDRESPGQGAAEPQVGGRLDWRRPSDLLPHLGRQVGDRVHQAHEQATKPGSPAEAIPATEQQLSRSASAGAPTSRQGIAHETAPSLSPLSAFSQTPLTIQSDGLSR